MARSLSRSALLTTLVLAFASVPSLVTACGSEGPGPVEAPDAAVDAAVTTPVPDVASPSPSGPSGPVPEAGVDASYPSRCTVTADKVSCTHVVTKLDAGSVTRDVYWQTPSSPPPPAGYPVVVLYQGSLGGPSLTWGEVGPSTPFGGFHQGRLQAMLLDSGFTVVAPEAAAGVAWQTNSGVPWNLTTDKDVIDALLAKIEIGDFGPANMTRLYATGISSGGYMTSRMAVSYAGTFRALAIQSASYATCVGAACVVPALPDDHPPTLFLHGQLDLTVPLYTSELYHGALVAKGIETSKTVDPSAGHEWLSTAPEKVTTWFTTH